MKCMKQQWNALMRRATSWLLVLAIVSGFVSIGTADAASAEVSVFDGTYPTSVEEITWFNQDDVKSEYTITSAEMLADLSYLVGTEGVAFEGTTFYLGCDIVWNEGVFSLQSNGDPLYNGAVVDSSVNEWIPIGNNNASPNNNYTAANGFDKQFYGNFDGQGHTISGLYTNDRTRMAGLFTVFYGDYIKNLSIVNSYFGADSRSGTFFGGCYATKDWGTDKSTASVVFENLYSDAYIVVDSNNSRSGGLGGMIRPLGSSDAATNGFIAEFDTCWFDGTVCSTDVGQFNGGLVGVAAYGDSGGLGSTICFNDCLVTADIHSASGGNIGLVLGNIYQGIADLNNIVVMIEGSNITSVSSSGVVSTLQSNKKATVTVDYESVYYVPAGTLSGANYYYYDSTAGTTAIVNGAPILDNQYFTAAAKALGSEESKFAFSGSSVILKGFGFTLPESDNSGSTSAEVSVFDGTYPTSVEEITWFNQDDVKSEYTITSAEMLADLSYLVGTEGVAFKGTTFYLGCDIVWNEGEFSLQSNGDPLYNGAVVDSSVNEWIPIGNNNASPSNNYTAANGFDKQFYGNFDGQGHTISGLYTNDRTRMAGLFTVFYGDYIKNLSIVNSYFGADSRSGTFFGGCYATKDWGSDKTDVSVILENLYSNAFVVTDLNDNSRSGGLGGMIRPLGSSDAATNGFIVEIKHCWYDGTLYCTADGRYNGGLIGVAAYGDTGGLGSTLRITDCLVTAGIYANDKAERIGLAIGDMYLGIAELNGVVIVVESTNISAVTNSAVVAMLEGNNSAKVTIKYSDVYYVPSGALEGDDYLFTKCKKDKTAFLEGTPAEDDSYLTSAAAALGGVDSAFAFCGSEVILKGFEYTLPEFDELLIFTELEDGTYSVAVGNASALSAIDIPAVYNGKAVTRIAADGFAGCTKLEEICIPASITGIDSRAFAGCSGLDVIIYRNPKATWYNVDKADDYLDGIAAPIVVCTDGTATAVEMNGVSLDAYTIVLPDKFTGSQYRLAVYLKKQLDGLCRTDIEIRTDAVDYGYEVLIGSTVRTTAAAPASEHTYTVDFEGSDLQVQAGSVYAYDALSSYLLEKMFFSATAISTCAEGYTWSENIADTLTEGQEYTVKRDGDLRLMFFNIWGNSTTSVGPRDQHQMLAMEVVDAYAPDIVGLQEFNNHVRDDGWWSADTLLESYGYKEVTEFEYVRKYLDDKGGKHEVEVTSDGTRVTNNFTPIFYNPEKVTLVEAKFVPYGAMDADGYHVLDDSRRNPYDGYYYKYNDYFSKSLTLAVFTDNATGEKFAVISTHFWWKTGTEGDAERVENALIINAEVEELLKKYPDLPVFVGGDFNCKVSSDAYKTLLSGGLVNVQTIAERTEDHSTHHAKPGYDNTFTAGSKYVGIDVNANNEESDNKQIVSGYIGAWTSWTRPSGDYDASIDHIFVKDTGEKVDVKMFDIVASKMALLASDHCPIITDFSFVRPADQTALAALVNEVEALDENVYTSDSWAGVEVALEAAKKVLADEDATQEEVNAAKAALEAAVAALKLTVLVNEPTVKGSYTYTGSEQTVELEGFDSSYMTITGNKGTNAGDYEVTVTLADGYAWADDADGKITWTIAKADAEITVDTAPISVTYGEAVTLPAATANFGTVTCDKTAADLVNAGEYTVTYTVEAGDNWNGTTVSVTVSVAKKAAQLTALDRSIMISSAPIDFSDPVIGRDYKAEGLVDGDTVEVRMSCDANMYRAGSYTIVITAENSNYDFTLVNGTLVVVAGSGDVGGTTPGGMTPGTQPVVCNCHKFTDVNTSLWYHEAVCFAVNRGIMNGTGDSTFSPSMNLSRAMMMTMLARLDGVDTSGGSTWYEKGMKWAMDNGISDGTNPNGQITREQMVTMLYRYAGSPAVSENLIENYKDADQVSSWAVDAMNWAVANGIIQGKGDNILDPKGAATRAEVAQILYKYLTL